MRYFLLVALVAVAFSQEKPFEFDGQITTIPQTHGTFAAPFREITGHTWQGAVMDFSSATAACSIRGGRPFSRRITGGVRNMVTISPDYQLIVNPAAAVPRK